MDTGYGVSVVGCSGQPSESTTAGRASTFSLTVGGPDPGSNWLDLGDDAAFVIIREYTHDRVDGLKATFDIEQLTPELVHRPELDADRLTSVLGLLPPIITKVINI